MYGLEGSGPGSDGNLLLYHTMFVLIPREGLTSPFFQSMLISTAVISSRHDVPKVRVFTGKVHHQLVSKWHHNFGVFVVVMRNPDDLQQ